MSEADDAIRDRIAEMVHTLKWHRNQRGWTQAQVAELLGVQPNTIAHMETLRQIPNLTRLAQWAALFDLKVGLFNPDLAEDFEDFQDQDDLDDALEIIVGLQGSPPPGYDYRARVAA